MILTILIVVLLILILYMVLLFITTSIHFSSIKAFIKRPRTNNQIYMKFEDFKFIYHLNPNRYEFDIGHVDVYERPRPNRVSTIEFNFVDRIRYYWWSRHPEKRQVDHEYFRQLKITRNANKGLDLITKDIDDYMGS